MRKFLPFILFLIECEGAGGRKKVFIWRFLIHNRLIICVYLAFSRSQLIYVYLAFFDSRLIFSSIMPFGD